MAGERAPIPSYGHPRPARRGVPAWLRFALAVPAYFLVLWLALIPAYPLPVLAKGALGFFLAGAAAGRVAGRRGAMAGLLGFAVLLVLALGAVALTLTSPGLGPSLLVNSETAHGDPDAVGKVGAALLRELLLLAVAAGVLSALGGGVGSRLRGRAGGRW